MNKFKLLITVLFSLALMVSPSVSKELRIGASVGFAQLEASGSEKLKDSSVITTHTEQANAVVPSLFAEIATDNGYGIGIDFITGSADLAGSKRTRINTNDGPADSLNDANTNVANAEVDGIVTTYLIKSFDSGFLIKVGMASADINTTETLGTGSTYGNKSVDGAHYGIGYDINRDSGTFVRTSLEHTDFDEITLKSGVADAVTGTFNNVKADVDVTMLKLSIGKKF